MGLNKLNEGQKREPLFAKYVQKSVSLQRYSLEKMCNSTDYSLEKMRTYDEYSLEKV